MQKGLCTPKDCDLEKVESKISKNFNLLVTLKNGLQLLVKQKSCPGEEISDEFLYEWQLYKFVQSANALQPLTVETVLFDADNSILISKYLSDYNDLNDFYAKENSFPESIAALMGTSLATIHHSTLENPECKALFAKNHSLADLAGKMDPHKLMRLSPEVFGAVSLDAIEFFVLFQRYESLGKAIAEVINSFTPRCLTHNDLKMANILLRANWGGLSSDSGVIRFIDWEFCAWGDPAYDLGSLIASYLKIWLNSIVISSSIDIKEALRFAVTPLEYIQPSLVALVRAYLHRFPEILIHDPQFLSRVIQFSGLVLVDLIQTAIRNRESFDNTDICMLQIAKGLLCNPEHATQSVFGVSESELIGQPVLIG